MPEVLHNVKMEVDAESELNLEIIRQSSMMGERTKKLRGKKMKYETVKYICNKDKENEVERMGLRAGR